MDPAKGGQWGGAITGVLVSLLCPCHCGLHEAAPTAMGCPTDVVSLVFVLDVLEGQGPSRPEPKPEKQSEIPSPLDPATPLVPTCIRKRGPLPGTCWYQFT